MTNETLKERIATKLKNFCDFIESKLKIVDMSEIEEHARSEYDKLIEDFYKMKVENENIKEKVDVKVDTGSNQTSGSIAQEIKSEEGPKDTGEKAGESGTQQEPNNTQAG